MTYLESLSEEDGDEFYLNNFKKIKKRCFEIFVAIFIGTIALNFMVFYTFWSIVNSIITTQWTIAIVIIVGWFISSIFKDKISTFIFMFLFISPLLNNTSNYSFTLIGVVFGITYLGYFVKNKTIDIPDLEKHLLKLKFIIAVIVIIICIPLYGFFPFKEVGVYQDLLDFQFYKKIINLIPLIVLIIIWSFSNNYIWMILGYLLAQSLTSGFLGFGNQLNSQNEFNFIFSDLSFFESFGNLDSSLNFLKIPFNILITFILCGFIMVLEEKMNSYHSKIFSEFNYGRDNHKIIKEILAIPALEIGYWGAKVDKKEFLVDEEPLLIKKNILLEGAESLIKSINLAGLFNALVILVLSINLNTSFLITVLSLLKYNWILYILFILLTTLISMAKGSNFLFKNWEFYWLKSRNSIWRIQVK
ncbi:hypothetical protein [Spiroplasma sabaudiense]|nr:hypothetical protein [Spiroplasma sabaudiense]